LTLKIPIEFVSDQNELKNTFTLKGIFEKKKRFKRHLSVKLITVIPVIHSNNMVPRSRSVSNMILPLHTHTFNFLSKLLMNETGLRMRTENTNLKTVFLLVELSVIVLIKTLITLIKYD
jgi:hypothetical protein